MNGWILYKQSQNEVEPDNYEIARFVEAAGAGGVGLRVVKPDDFDLIVTRDDRKSIRLDGAVVPLPVFLLPRMGAGTTYFALAVIRHLERLGVRTFNKSTSIEQVQDKLYTQQILAASDLPFAKTMLAKFPPDVDLVERYLGFPVVVKTVSGSLGTGVFLAETRQPVCSPALLRTLPLATPEHLRDHTLLHSSNMPRLWSEWLTLAGVPGLAAAGNLVLDHFYLSVEAAAGGLGVAMGPGALIGADLASGRLAAPFPHLAMPARSYCAYVPAHAEGQERITAFCDWLAHRGASAN